MSIPVDLEQLRSTLTDRVRQPYLLTTGADGRPHSVEVEWRWHDDELETPAGNRTLTNARAQELVALLWPPDDAGGYSLIVDGTVTHTEGTGTGDNGVRIRPTRAVLHRPARPDNPATDTGCGADCVPLVQAVPTT